MNYVGIAALLGAVAFLLRRAGRGMIASILWAVPIVTLGLVVSVAGLKYFDLLDSAGAAGLALGAAFVIGFIAILQKL